MPTPAELRVTRAELELLIEQRQAELGPDDPALADDLRQLGRIVHDLGDFADATALLERARALHIQEHGPEHPEVATDLNHLGLVLHDAGDLEVAYSVFERALSIDERTQGPRIPAWGAMPTTWPACCATWATRCRRAPRWNTRSAFTPRRWVQSTRRRGRWRGTWRRWGKGLGTRGLVVLNRLVHNFLWLAPIRPLSRSVNRLYVVVGPRGETTIWSGPRKLIVRLRELWAEGHSTAEIGRRLGVSKNAVVGKAHRLDLSARPSPIRREGETALSLRQQMRRMAGPTLPPLASTGAGAAAVQSLPRPMPVVLTPRPAPPPPAPRVAPPPPPRPYGRVITCCWPIGEPGTRSFRFCDAESVPGKPYCDRACAACLCEGA